MGTHCGGGFVVSHVSESRHGAPGADSSVHFPVRNNDQVGIGDIQRTSILGEVDLHDIFLSGDQADTAYLDNYLFAPFATIFIGD
jgi:hypothetical protein